MIADIKVIYKDKNLIAINKPVGMPSQSDPTGDADALSLTSALLASMEERAELYLLHRLDRGVGGVLVFARNKKTAADVSALIAERKVEKEYIAIARGCAAEGEYRDLLYKDARQGKSFVASRVRSGVKEALLYAKVLERKTIERGEVTLLKLSLFTGRHHQIRVQTSTRGTPLLGDKKYGDNDRLTRYPALFATKVAFTLGAEKYEFSASVDAGAYPWCEMDTLKGEVT